MGLIHLHPEHQRRISSVFGSGIFRWGVLLDVQCACFGAMHRRWIGSLPRMHLWAFILIVQYASLLLLVLATPMFSIVSFFSPSVQICNFDWMWSVHFLLHISCIDGGQIPFAWSDFVLVQVHRRKLGWMDMLRFSLIGCRTSHGSKIAMG